MGGEIFIMFETGRGIKSAFSKAVKNALYHYGHRGYTGTIAEKEYVVEIPIPKDFNPDMAPEKRAEAWANELISKEDDRINDTWGPAGGAFVAGEGKEKTYIFFGWASS